MAIRKDLDDMLNNLKDFSGGTGSPARSHNVPRAVRKSRFDDMSVDDLLLALEAEKHTADEEPQDSSQESIPLPDVENCEDDSVITETEAPNIINEVMHTEASAEMTRVFDSIPTAEELPKPTKKKRIVITGELPDYEALRREEFEKEKQAQRAAEIAAEEARAAERTRRAAEAAAERQHLAEEAEQRRLALAEAENRRRAEEAEMLRRAEEKRQAEEAERLRIAEERRLAEEAERLRIAEEEAERERLSEELLQRQAMEEAERQRRIDEMQRLAEEAAKETDSEPMTFIEETIVNASAGNDTDNAVHTSDEAEEDTSAEKILTNDYEKSKKIGFFKKLKNRGRDEAKEDFAPDNEPAIEDGLFEADTSSLSATELIDAAIAAINGTDESDSPDESDPVGNMLDNIREDAAEAIADMNAPREEDTAPAEKTVLSDDDIIAGLTDELKTRFDELSPDKQQQVIEMRRAQLGGVAPEPDSVINFDQEEIYAPEAEDVDNISVTGEETEENAAPESAAETASDSEEKKPKGKIASAIGNILDENPDELIAQRSEDAEDDDFTAVNKSDRKKRIYSIIGIVVTVFAVIGVITTIVKGVGFFRSFTSGEVRKDGFTQMIYPAAIMDIEPFSDPSQLTSEQIITATIWSVIMDDSKISKYELTLDTVTIPDVDVEKYAVELFGENIPAFVHATTGPVESRFYYSEGAYNVKVQPITHTYAPEIKSIVKNGNEYTLTVDYVDELPQWMDKTVSKQVEFILTEKEDGSFRYDSMKILSVNSGNL